MKRQLELHSRNVKVLHQVQTGPTRRRFRYLVGFQSAAIGQDDKRARCHTRSERSTVRSLCGQISRKCGGKIPRNFSTSLGEIFVDSTVITASVKRIGFTLRSAVKFSCTAS